MAAKDVIIEPKSYREKIKCPGCGLVQTAMVLLTKPFRTKQHTCIQCGTEIDAYGTKPFLLRRIRQEIVNQNITYRFYCYGLLGVAIFLYFSLFISC
jgi:ribosomal protein S27E